MVKLQRKKIKYNKITRILLIMAIYFMFYPMNKYIFNAFGYMGYYVYDGISIWKFCIGIGLVLFLAIYGEVIKTEFLHCTYDMFLIMFLLGEVCCWVCDINYRTEMIIIMIIFLLFFKVIDKIKIIVPRIKMKHSPWNVLFLIGIILFIPFLQYIPIINLKNLLLVDVYETRTVFENISMPAIMGYAIEPLSRVILPMLVVKFLKEKKYFFVLFVSGMIAYLYLCGAVKSIFFGLICAIAFFWGSYQQKGKMFLIALFGAEVLSIVLYEVLDISILLSLLRRVLIVPARLNQYYIDYFTDNYTYYTHAATSIIGAKSEFMGLPISDYIGTYVIGTGVNANVGIFVEGFYSFGIIGAIIYLIVPLLILFFIKVIDYSPEFYGIVFVYIYYFNTSILSTLLLTHGLLCFLIIAFFCLRKRDRKKF